MFPGLIFQVSLYFQLQRSFSCCDFERSPMTLTYEPDLDRVRLNYNAKHLGQRLFRSTVIMRTHRHTHTAESLPYLDHRMVGKRILWPPCVADADIIFSSCGFFFFLSSFFLASSQRSQSGCLPYFHTWCGLSANFKCRSEVCCTRLAEIEDAKNRQKFAICAPSHNFVGPYLRN